MADERPGPSFAGGNWVLLAVAMASAIYVSLAKLPLEGTRPPGTAQEINRTGAPYDVDAHLWQDPLAAAAAHLAEEAREAHPEHHLQLESPGGSNSLVGDPKPLVLGVMVPGTRHAEDVEMRLRQRYAVVAALNVQHYLPEDAEHIGYVRVNRDPSDRSAIKPNIVPYEWFHHADRDLVGRSDPSVRPIVVLWLDESVLVSSPRPLRDLARLACTLNLRPLVLIGPQESRVLSSFVSDDSVGSTAASTGSGACADDTWRSSLPGMEIYNFGATVDDATLLRLTDAKQRLAADYLDLPERFKHLGMRYYRIINSDSRLTEALVQELARRGVDPQNTGSGQSPGGMPIKSHRDHVALISEWDTVYGRSLPESFIKSFLSHGRPPRTPGAAEPPYWIHKFSYLRGLDGQLPERREADRRSTSDQSPGVQKETAVQRPEPADDARKRETPAGQSQYDYLRRLSDHIRELDDGLRGKGAGRIAAIGILGSDVYDKLLILQALRPEFPEALFFTTDLDARLLPQEKSRQTRNLLVASSFGFKLRGALQSDVPPFRGVYQTSIFLATQLAIRNNLIAPTPGNIAATETATRKRLDAWRDRVRLFEIGRTRANPLPSSPEDLRPDRDLDAAGRDQACRDDILNCTTVHPRNEPLYPTLKPSARYGVAVAGTIMLLGLAMAFRRVRRWCFPPSVVGQGSLCSWLWRAVPIVGVCLITALVPAALVGWWPAIGGFLTRYGLGEPMMLIEGVSIWPPIILRLIGACLCGYLIWLTYRLTRKNLDDTNQRLRLRMPKFGLLRRRWLRRKARPCWRRLATTLSYQPIVISPSRKNAPYPILKFLVRFAYDGRGGARTLRAAVGTAAMMAVWLVLVSVFDAPNIPSRGHLASSLYWAATVADVLTSLFLTFLVIDAMLYSRAFIRSLTDVISVWPPRTVRYFANELGMRGEDIDDYIDVQWMALRTVQFGKLIYFPFIALALLIMSRSTIFDNFAFSATLLITQIIVLGLIVASVIALRNAAEGARGAARQHLTARLVAAKGREGREGLAAPQLELLLANIDNLRAGAFAPWSNQPVVRAVLLPLLTYGGATLVQAYALPGF